MKCQYCEKEMTKGRIRCKASVLNATALSSLVWTDEKDIGKLKRNEVKLSEENEAWYCETCNRVVAEINVKPPLF